MTAGRGMQTHGRAWVLKIEKWKRERTTLMQEGNNRGNFVMWKGMYEKSLYFLLNSSINSKLL